MLALCPRIYTRANKMIMTIEKLLAKVYQWKQPHIQDEGDSRSLEKVYECLINQREKAIKNKTS